MHENVYRLSACVAAVASVSAFSLAAHAEAPVMIAPTPERPAETEVRPNPGLLAPGAAMFTVSYGSALIVAALSDHKGDKNLYVPVAGPWINLASRGCAPGETANCGTTPLESAGLVGMGVAQLAGLTQTALSFVFPLKKPAVTVGSTRIEVTPTPLAGGFGLTAAGKF